MKNEIHGGDLGSGEAYFLVERADGQFPYREYRYALSRYAAPGSAWATLTHYPATQGLSWPCGRLLRSRSDGH